MTIRAREFTPCVRLVCALLAFSWAGCSNEVEGPQPSVEPPAPEAEPPPLDPEVVCRDQHTSRVTVHGDGLSPVPIDIPNDPKVALPTVKLTRSHTLDGSEVAEPDEVIWSGDPDADDTNSFDEEDEPLLSWQSQSEMRFVINQSLVLDEEDVQGRLEEGVWDVSVVNANGSEILAEQSVAVVGMPEVSEVSPGIVCLSQGERSISLDGQRFLRNEDAMPVVDVEGRDDPLDVDLSSCTAIAHEGMDAEVCEQAEVTLAEGAIDTGFPGLTLRNPETAACTSEDDINLRVVPPPSISAVEPALGCVTEEDRTFVIQGSDFLRIDGEDPALTVGDTSFAVGSMDGCETVETQGHEVERCSSMTFTVAQDELAPDLYSVTVANPEPAGCENTAEGSLRIVPPPNLQEVQPPLVCVDDGARDITLMGSDFLLVNAAKPSVEIDGEPLDASAVTPQGCEDLEIAGGGVERCDSLVATIEQNGVDLGMPNIKVTNPDPAGCSDESSELLSVVEGPSIDSIDPVLACTVDGSQGFTIQGSGILQIDDAEPIVNINGAAVASIDGYGGCESDMLGALAVQTCDSIQVTVAQDALSEGRPAVEVINPDPAGCSASRNDVLTVPPALQVASLDPVNVCQNSTAAIPLTVSGQGMLRFNGTEPTVRFDGSEVASVSTSNCTELDVAGADTASSCNTLMTEVTPTAAQTGTAGAMLAVEVFNDHVNACSLSAGIPLTVVSPPTVDSVSVTEGGNGDHVCGDTTTTLTISGSGFVAGATVTLSNNNQDITADSVSDPNEDGDIVATFNDGIPYDADDEDYDLIVANADGCAATEPYPTITVDPSPLVFFVDPPVVYNQLTVDVNVFTTGLTADSTLGSVELINEAGDASALTVVEDPSTDTESNRIVATVPGVDPGSGSPTFAAGSYDVRVTSSVGCEGTLNGGLTITDTTNDALLSSIDPGFVSPTSDTDVTVEGSGFAPVPRLYISPSDSDGKARALKSVEIDDSGRLTAIVPADAADPLADTEDVDYDLIYVSPDGEVDVIPRGVTAVVNEPPIVTSTVPQSLISSQAGQDLTVVGENFDADAVQLRCDDAGTLTTVDGTIDASNATEVAASFDVPGLDTGTVCLVRLTNTDGSYFDYSAVSITNSSRNLADWDGEGEDVDPGDPLLPAMTTGRRALALEAARPTRTSRFLYAMGGDNGVMGDDTAIGDTIHSSVEAARVSVFGDVGEWSLQRNSLPGQRTWADSARIGRFIYMVGGHDGTSATPSVWRSEVLDPRATPDIEDLDAVLEDGTTGLGGEAGCNQEDETCLYYYQVSAIFPDNDANNPGGESLAGELLPVQLPDREEGISLTLEWSEIEGAHGYRVYRTPTAGASPDQLELLSEVTCGSGPNDICNCATNPEQCELTDSGDATDDTQTPLPAGSLGIWHDVDGPRCSGATTCELGTPREAHRVFAIEDPNNPGTHYLYAFGGRDDNGAYLDTYEYATITVDSNGGQEMADWVTPTQTLESPRAELGVWVMSKKNSRVIRESASPDDVWVYYGSGLTTGGTADSNMQAGLLLGTGELDTFQSIGTGMSGSLFGLSVGAANDQLYTFGGADGASGTSAVLCGAGNSGACGGLPNLEPGAWNSLGNATTERRYGSSAQESAFFFLAGGHDGANTLTDILKTVQ